MINDTLSTSNLTDIEYWWILTFQFLSAVHILPPSTEIKYLFHCFDPSRQGVVTTSCCSCMISHCFHHCKALHSITRMFTHLNKWQPIAFTAVADDFIDVPSDVKLTHAAREAKNLQYVCRCLWVSLHAILWCADDSNCWWRCMRHEHTAGLGEYT